MLNHNAEVVFSGGSDFYNSSNIKHLRVSDFSFDFGLQATIPLQNKNKVDSWSCI